MLFLAFAGCNGLRPMTRLALAKVAHHRPAADTEVPFLIPGGGGYHSGSVPGEGEYTLTARNARKGRSSTMARKTIFVSDLSGKEIDDRNAAQVVINYRDARRGRVVLDVN